MERIKLSNEEKRLLRNIQEGASFWPDGMGDEELANCADVLADKGLIHAQFGSGHELVSAELSQKGYTYLRKNPHLHNPIPWNVVTAISTALTALIALAAFILGLIACARL